MRKTAQQLSWLEIFEGWFLRSKEKPSRRAPSKKPKRKRRAHPGTSDPALYEIWKGLRHQWFSERHDLDQYIVTWSNRPQKRTLASCNIHRKKVLVAREMMHPDCQRWLSPLIYHEMCHAVLGESVKRWHGPEFKALERLHPEMKEFDLWVKSGGWAKAVRSDRAKRSYQKRVQSNG